MTDTTYATDIEDLKNLSMYSNYYGIQKTICMINDTYQSQIDALQKQAKQMQESAEASKKLADAVLWLNATSKEREKSWAVAGGIANGLAGPVAGIATAIDVQIQNSEIRARNAVRSQQAVSTSTQFKQYGYHQYNSAEACLKKAQSLKSEMDELKREYQRRRIGLQNDTEAFNYVIIKDLDYCVNPTKSVFVSMRLFQSAGCQIDNSGKKAYVDGTLLAKIFQNNVLIGTADIVLPLEGLSSYNASAYLSSAEGISVSGISICNANPTIRCEIEVMPKNLWLVEAE